MLRKSVSLILICIMLLTSFLYVSADEGQLTFTMERGNGSLEGGVEIGVFLSNMDSIWDAMDDGEILEHTGIMGFSFRISFNKDILEPVAFSGGKYIEAGGVPYVTDVTLDLNDSENSSGLIESGGGYHVNFSYDGKNTLKNDPSEGTPLLKIKLKLRGGVTLDDGELVPVIFEYGEVVLKKGDTSGPHTLSDVAYVPVVLSNSEVGGSEFVQVSLKQYSNTLKEGETIAATTDLKADIVVLNGSSELYAYVVGYKTSEIDADELVIVKVQKISPNFSSSKSYSINISRDSLSDIEQLSVFIWDDNNCPIGNYEVPIKYNVQQ